jgi:hypothetical protein
MAGVVDLHAGELQRAELLVVMRLLFRELATLHQCQEKEA